MDFSWAGKEDTFIGWFMHFKLFAQLTAGRIDTLQISILHLFHLPVALRIHGKTALLNAIFMCPMGEKLFFVLFLHLCIHYTYTHTHRSTEIWRDPHKQSKLSWYVSEFVCKAAPVNKPQKMIQLGETVKFGESSLNTCKHDVYRQMFNLLSLLLQIILWNQMSVTS